MTGKYAVAVGGSRGLGSPTENIYQLHSRTVEHLQNQLAKLMHRKVKQNADYAAGSGNGGHYIYTETSGGCGKGYCRAKVLGYLGNQ